jgi:branched-chain amino acid transport system ATP-binding protein
VTALAPSRADAVKPLRCERLSKRFGGIAAVHEVSISIPARGIYGLCGPNGAGKSTLFNLLAGALRPDAGEVWLTGERVTQRSATYRARRGLARTWQAVRLIEDRTVLDNVAAVCLRSAGQSLWGAMVRTGWASARAQARAVLEQLELLPYAGRQAGELTLEGQRMVEVARAVAQDPAVLLADEPASGLSAAQRRVLAELLRRVAESRPLLVVEHDLDMLEQISERIYAMVEGRLVFEGERGEFAASEVGRALRGLGAAGEMSTKERRADEEGK